MLRAVWWTGLWWPKRTISYRTWDFVREHVFGVTLDQIKMFYGSTDSASLSKQSNNLGFLPILSGWVKWSQCLKKNFINNSSKPSPPQCIVNGEKEGVFHKTYNTVFYDLWVESEQFHKSWKMCFCKKENILIEKIENLTISSCLKNFDLNVITSMLVII